MILIPFEGSKDLPQTYVYNFSYIITILLLLLFFCVVKVKDKRRLKGFLSPNNRGVQINGKSLLDESLLLRMRVKEINRVGVTKSAVLRAMKVKLGLAEHSRFFTFTNGTRDRSPPPIISASFPLSYNQVHSRLFLMQTLAVSYLVKEICLLAMLRFFAKPTRHRLFFFSNLSLSIEKL